MIRPKIIPAAEILAPRHQVFRAGAPGVAQPGKIAIAFRRARQRLHPPLSSVIRREVSNWTMGSSVSDWNNLPNGRLLLEGLMLTQERFRGGSKAARPASGIEGAARGRRLDIAVRSRILSFHLSGHSGSLPVGREMKVELS
jgi:hypothetical protein